MEYIVPDVPYIGQKTPATCWNAAYKMMLKWKRREESNADSLPNEAAMRERGILDSEFLLCREKLGLTSSVASGFQTAEDIETKLNMYGPIWVSGDYCEGKYKHILILRGVRDPWVGAAEVFVNDPYSQFRYGLPHARWIDLKLFAKRMNKVHFSCQHWG